MAKRISDLPVSGATTSGDQNEVDQGGVSKRQAASQVATFMETNLSKLSLSGGNFTLAADGTIVIAPGVGAVGAIKLNPDGSAVFAGAFTPSIDITAAGDIEVPGALRADSTLIAGQTGSAGTITVNDAANVTQIQLNGDGSATFGLNSVSISPVANPGNIEVGGAGNDGKLIVNNAAGLPIVQLNGLIGEILSGNVGIPGTLTLKDNGNVTTIDLEGGGGTASFASGAFFIDNVGTPLINSLAGITQDVVVLTALPSTFVTLHFELGILTSVV